SVDVSRHVVPDIIVGPRKPDANSITAIGAGGIAACLEIITRPTTRTGDIDNEVVVNDIVALVSLHRHDAGARPVINDVVLDQPIVAVIYRDPPPEGHWLQGADHRVADKRVLIAIRGSGGGPNQVMEVDRVTILLVGADMGDVAAGIECR